MHTPHATSEVVDIEKNDYDEKIVPVTTVTEDGVQTGQVKGLHKTLRNRHMQMIAIGEL